MHSMILDGSDKFFTIDENYCPTMQHPKLNFEEILRQTLFYYVENVNQSRTETIVANSFFSNVLE